MCSHLPGGGPDRFMFKLHKGMYIYIFASSLGAYIYICARYKKTNYIYIYIYVHVSSRSVCVYINIYVGSNIYIYYECSRCIYIYM